MPFVAMPDKAFEWLDRAYQKRNLGVMAIIDNPFTHELRSVLALVHFARKSAWPGRRN